MLESPFNKVAGLQAWSYIKKRLQHMCFPVNVVKFFKTPILKNIWTAVSVHLSASSIHPSSSFSFIPQLHSWQSIHKIDRKTKQETEPCFCKTAVLDKHAKIVQSFNIVLMFFSATWNKYQSITAQKIKLCIKNFFSKCDQIRGRLRIWSDLLKKYSIGNFIFLCSAWSKSLYGCFFRKHDKDIYSFLRRHLLLFETPAYILARDFSHNTSLCPLLQESLGFSIKFLFQHILLF